MRRRDRLMPAVAFVLLATMGLLILVLVNDAESSGREALEDSLTGEVEAIARSQDSRVDSQLTGIQGLAAQPWELQPGSESDAQRLGALFALVEGAIRSGFFLTDASGRVTDGVNFIDPGVIGQRYERPGLDELVESADPDFSRGVFLPVVAEGLTTEVPNYALVFLIGDPADGGVRGTFVFEAEVVPDSDFNEEITQLRHGDTGEYNVFDSNGSVIAATDPSMLATTVSDDVRRAPEGSHDIDGDIVVLADIESAGWRLVFTQDRDEFEDGLAGPLQRVATIAVVAFVLLGIASFVALSRRLRAAQEEQDRLRQLYETQEEFISIVSHELRTPVAGVLGFLQTTIDHWDVMTDTERSAAVLRAASNARRLQGLTRDVLDSQSVESGRMTYAMNPADLREEVAVAVDAARALHPAQRFEMRLEVDSAPVHMDVDRIQQVLTNLIDNAVRSSPPDEPIEVRLWAEEGRARVSVLDHGPGLPADLEERVFEKFVRGRSGTVTGTGLGLYIARQILQAHDGSISVSSPPGEGANFVIDLPLSEAPVPQ